MAGTAARAVGAVALGGAAVVAAVALTSGSEGTTTATTTVSVPAPQNLRVVEVGPDHAKVSFGPSVVGPFYATDAAPDGRSVVVHWGAAFDTLYPTGITYDYYKNGKLVWANRAQTYARVGFTLAVRSFKVCAVPHSQSGYGPKRCTTFTGSAPS